jgi:rhodanese-related sulfurtransferase
MSVLLSCWLLATCAILIWCSLKVSEGQATSGAWRERTAGHLEYIPISQALLAEWALRDEQLMIIDLRPHMQAGEGFESIPGSLQIPPMHLSAYLSYLPPNTRLLLCDGAAARLDTGAESFLLKIGIEAVYILEESTGTWQACVNCNGNGVTQSDSSAVL